MSSRLFKQFIKKAILERQPGPPPREGLRWKPSTHRWIRPKEQVSQLGTGGGGGKYNPETVEQQRPKLQQIMNERLGEYVASGQADLGDYEIGQNMDLFTKIHNEVMLGDTAESGGKSVFDEAGIDTENLSEEEEQHFYDFMDSITESAMEQHGVTNYSPDDEDEDHESVVTYTDFIVNVVNEGLVDSIPGFLTDYKSNWEGRKKSVRPEWGSREWADEVNEITFEAGFAMPEGGENEDEDLDKASNWMASKIREEAEMAGIKGFENFGLDDDEIDTDPEGLSTHGHQNFLREEAERKKAGIVRPYDSPDYRL